MEAAGVNMTINSSHKKVFIRTMIAVMLMLTMATTGILINENIQEKISNIAKQTIRTGMLPSKTSSLPTKNSPLSLIVSTTKIMFSIATTDTVTMQAPALNSAKESMSPNPTKAAATTFAERATIINEMTSRTVTKQSETLDKSTEPSSPTKATTLMSIEKTSTVDKATSSLTKEINPATPTVQTSTDVKATSSSTKEINPATPTVQTSTDDKATSSSTKAITTTSPEQTSTAGNGKTNLPCSTRPIAALPIVFSSINSNSCLGISSALCNNGSGIDIVPSYCECAEDGIWTIIQKRFDGSVNFFRNWTDYKEGFGDLDCEYWLGNNALHQITANANYTLKIYLTDWNNVTKYAMYNTFRIADEADGYCLTIGGYSGDAGDSMITRHDGQMFSTKDRNNDGSVFHKGLAEYFSGAWWYGAPSTSSLNGKYHFGPYVNLSFSNGYGIWWGEYSQYRYSMKETTMLIKTK